jgi:hypothetical protein
MPRKSACAIDAWIMTMASRRRGVAPTLSTRPRELLWLPDETRAPGRLAEGALAEPLLTSDV